MDDPETANIYTELARTALDGLILSTIHLGGAMSGADVQRRINTTHGVNISPGAVYPRLQSLADDGLLCKRETPNETLYGVDDHHRTQQRFKTLAECHVELADTYIDACATEHTEFDTDALRRRLYEHVTESE